MIKHLLNNFIILITLIGLSSCYNDKVLPNDDVIVPGEVSYSQDIQTIWDQSCNSAGCHNNGGIPPNLTAGASLGALNGGGYLNTDDPESSELYQWMIGNRDLDMPLSGPNAQYNATVLAWIRQGALDN